jgi:uncharacterized protein YodC (DUF2158 family)
MSKFEVGDCVRLKSGGPPMTVYIVTENPTDDPKYTTSYSCEWFNSSNERMIGEFREVVLVPQTKGDVMAAAKVFKVGDKVKHPAADDGSFPAGCGAIECVEKHATGGGTSYKIRCDATGKVLPAIFLGSELSAV